jgi:hypothetical protein
VGATWGISGDVCVYICVFSGYANYAFINCLVRTDYGDDCVLPLSRRMPSIFAPPPFSFGEDG